MLNNSLSVQGQALGRWVQAYQNDLARSEEVRNTTKQRLISFIGVFTMVREGNIRTVVGQFRKNRIRMLSLIRYFEMLNSCREQSVRIGFTKWLRIDDGGQHMLIKQKLSVEFLRALEKFRKGRLGSFFGLIKENYKEAVVLSKFVGMEQLMSSLHETCRSNLSTIMRNPRDSALMSKALNRIIQSTNTNLRNCLISWLGAVRQKHLATVLTQ